MNELWFKRFVLRTDSDRTAGIIFDANQDPIQVVAVSNVISFLEDVCDEMNRQDRPERY